MTFTLWEEAGVTGRPSICVEAGSIPVQSAASSLLSLASRGMANGPWHRKMGLRGDYVEAVDSGLSSLPCVRFTARCCSPVASQPVKLEALDRSQVELLMFKRHCKHHGRTNHVIDNSGRTRCLRCRSAAVSKTRRKTKAKLVEEAGGCCCICRYRRCLQALQFHHLNPKRKRFTISCSNTYGIERKRKEVKKCILVCANCHAELEAGVTTYCSVA